MRTLVLFLVIALIYQFTTTTANNNTSAQISARSVTDTAFEPETFGYTDKEMYGAIGNKIYIRNGN